MGWGRRRLFEPGSSFYQRRGPCRVYVCFWEAGLLDGLGASMRAALSVGTLSPLVALTLLPLLLPLLRVHWAQTGI